MSEKVIKVEEKDLKEFLGAVESGQIYLQALEMIASSRTSDVSILKKIAADAIAHADDNCQLSLEFL